MAAKNGLDIIAEYDPTKDIVDLAMKKFTMDTEKAKFDMLKDEHQRKLDADTRALKIQNEFMDTAKDYLTNGVLQTPAVFGMDSEQAQSGLDAITQPEKRRPADVSDLAKLQIATGYKPEEGIKTLATLAKEIKDQMPFASSPLGIFRKDTGEVTKSIDKSEMTDYQKESIDLRRDQMEQNAQLRREQMQLTKILKENSGDSVVDRTFIRQTTQQLPKLKADAVTQSNNIGRIDTALDLVKKGVTGKGGQIKSFLAPYAEMFGESTENLNDAQTFQLLTRVIVGPMRLDIIGPGPVSEWEQKLMQDISGGGKAAKPAAVMLLNTYRQQAEAKVKNYNDTRQGLVDMYPKADGVYKPIELPKARQDQTENRPTGGIKIDPSKAKKGW